jgi:poly-gamma-glutamate capsule biosynthesis protein CapA/YwtB (metallophosphatase superfamily)
MSRSKLPFVVLIAVCLIGGGIHLFSTTFMENVLQAESPRLTTAERTHISPMDTADLVDREVQLVFAGDIMLADLPGEAIARGIDPFAEFTDVLQSADAAIGNLECVIATRGVPVDKPYTFRADPRVLPILGRHFQSVSLANNHSGDFGHDAFLEQLDLLAQQQIACFGGGRNCAEARQPLILHRKGLKIALLGYNEFQPRQFEAGSNWPGVAWSVDEQVVADLQAARTLHHADLVIPYMHWGDEHEPENDRQKSLARLMIDHGADLVIGGHPHVTQGVEYYKGKLIVYSLGNFVFDGFGEESGREGWLLRLKLNQNGLVEWDTIVARMDDQGIPHLRRDIASPSGRVGSGEIRHQPTVATLTTN